jgi:hypothetical protein
MSLLGFCLACADDSSRIRRSVGRGFPGLSVSREIRLTYVLYVLLSFTSLKPSNDKSFHSSRTFHTFSGHFRAFYIRYLTKFCSTSSNVSMSMSSNNVRGWTFAWR